MIDQSVKISSDVLIRIRALAEMRRRTLKAQVEVMLLGQLSKNGKPAR